MAMTSGSANQQPIDVIFWGQGELLLTMHRLKEARGSLELESPLYWLFRWDKS